MIQPFVSRIFSNGIARTGTLMVSLLLPLALTGCGESDTLSQLDAFLSGDTEPTQQQQQQPISNSTPAAGKPERPGGRTHEETGLPGKKISTGQKAEASRFLAQATFGPTMTEIEALTKTGNDYAAWLEQQIAVPATLHGPLAQSTGQNRRMDTWWSAVVDHNDQLRQRMAWALSQILVISDRPTILGNNQPAILDYYDLLVSNALGNYRNLLEQVTLSLPMGIYLSMKDSRKFNSKTGAHPDENYAREVMQLFTIGLWELEQDGSQRLVNGQPVPAYTQKDVEELARVFSGWGSADAWAWGNDFSQPMKAYPEYHDNGEKVFLGHYFPAGQSPEQDMQQALDVLFNHPNTGPFIARQLIQRFVTSNPSADYIARVAAVFNNNGNGERGDLAAVVRAILLDKEARKTRTANKDFGKLREPLLKVTHLWRNFSGKVKPDNYWKPEKDFLQAPLRSPTVFNFYHPDYSPAGAIRDAGMVAPEFQITTTTSITTSTNKLFSMITGYWDAQSTIDTTSLVPLVSDTEELIDYLDLVFMSNSMSDEMRQTISSLLETSEATDQQKANDALYLVISSAEYAIQR